MLGTLAVNVPSSEGCVTFALPVSVSAAMLVVLATLAVVIFALPSMSSAVLANVAETPVKAGRLTPPENWGAVNAEAADTEAGTIPMVYLVSLLRVVSLLLLRSQTLVGLCYRVTLCHPFENSRIVSI